jgi:hypothetical protein
MLLSGKLMLLNKSIIFALLFLFSLTARADFNQFLPDQKGMDTLDQIKPKGESSHLPQSQTRPVEQLKAGPKSGHLPGEKEKTPIFMYENTESGIQGMGAVKSEKYLEYNANDLLKETHGRGKSSFGFSYLKDSFSYKDEFNSFDTVYKEPSGTTQGGFLLFTSERYFSRKYIDLFANFAGGVGLSYGQGVFVSGDIAESNFRLWKIPLDAGLGIGIPLGPWFSVVGSAGPSVLGLIQNRSDQSRKSEKKERRQFSFGYYTQAAVRWNLSPIFKQASLNMLREQNVSNFYLNLFMRDNRYENFKQEDLIVSGQSIGLGFSFDFL